MKTNGQGKKILAVLSDILIANISVLIALLIRLIDEEPSLPAYLISYISGVPILSFFMMAIFAVFGVYRIMWVYARVRDAAKLAIATAVSFTIYMGLHFMISESLRVFDADTEFRRLPISTYFFGGVLSLSLMLAVRLFLRATIKRNGEKGYRSPDDERIMIIGGGTTGNMMLHDLRNNRAFINSRAVCVIDDDPAKIGMDMYGVRIVGDRNTIVENAKKFNVDRIIFAIPTCPPSEKAKILEICSRTGCPVGTVPSLDQLLDGPVGMSSIRKVNVEDLLGRDPINVDIDSIAQYVENKTVLVTGGGGSIGSELCRQLAKHNPKQLIIFDVYENNAYTILNELKANYPELNVTALIGTVRDTDRLDEIFCKYRPDIVYHAAAHKHVPLMEDSPKEAIKNNVFGTLNVVNASDKYGVKRFVMISTDKAVNPTNIMGASKRICEMIVQTRNKSSKTEFITVRFGNVLGSNGSVIPLFEKQIAEGGPVTVTDKRVVRYFMTIPEAVSLVLQAGAFGRGGEIFVLDMGKPMKIVDLAENLIRLSGFEPYTDIDIKFIGLRPGEKLFEELLMAEEGLKQTSNKLIYIGKPINIEEDKLNENLELLRRTLEKDGDIRDAVKRTVPTYMPEKESK